jgi:hypothetical protein
MRKINAETKAGRGWLLGGAGFSFRGFSPRRGFGEKLVTHVAAFDTNPEKLKK